MSRNLITMISLQTLVACGGDAGELPDLDVALDTAGLEQEIDHAEVVYTWLKGDFDSSDQARMDPSYFPVSLRACDATVRGLDGRILYIEQAMMDALDRPYRQRIYSVEEAEGQVMSRVFAIRDGIARQVVGACDQSNSLVLTIDDIEERRGCEVLLAPEGDEYYRGGTVGESCQSSLNGASYATSDVLLTARAIESWDQGWMASGEQAWGAMAGPYIFKRVK